VTDDDRLQRLNALKLRALVRDHLDAEIEPPTESFAPGAALVHRGRAWVLLADAPAVRLGAAILWALRHGATALSVIAEEGTGTLARRAAAFTVDIDVWHAAGRSLLPGVAEPLLPSPSIPLHHEGFRAVITEGGAEPNVEHGVLVGEVRGLEVCRVVDDPHTGSTRLEVGVGAHDREAFQMLHGDVPATESLARVVAAVVEHRRVGVAQHPLSRLAAERLLRWRIVEDPSLVGLVAVRPAEPPVPRRNLKDAVPCVAIGVDAAGEKSVIVCSTGVDLDLVPFATDARLAVEEASGDRVPLVIVLPPRDRVRATEEVNAALRRPAVLRTVA
jgi:hypothetical protein